MDQDGSQEKKSAEPNRLTRGVLTSMKYPEESVIKAKPGKLAMPDSMENSQGLLESTLAVPWEANAKTWQFTYVGPQAVKLLGYPVEQWYQKDFWVEHLHPEDRDYAIDFCVRSSGTQKDYVFDYRMIASDKRVVWLHDIVSVVATEGVPERLRGYMFDITERKVAEEELNRYRNHLEQIVEQRTAELAKANEQLTSDLVERSRTEELIRQQMQRLAILREITLTITSTLDLRTVLDTLLEQIDHLLPYSAATIRLLNRYTGKFEPVAWRNIDTHNYRLESDSAFKNEIVENKVPVFSANVQTDPRIREPEFFRKNGLVSRLSVPLMAKGEVLGMLNLYTKNEHIFTDEEVRFLTMLGNTASMAIQNSQLYEQVEKRTHELSALHAVTSTASESLELDKVLLEVIRKITEIFSFDATRVFLFNAQMDELHVRASFETKPEIFAQVGFFRRGQGIVGKVAETGEPIIFDNIQSDPRYQETSHTKNSQSRGFDFFATFPIKSKLETVGAIVCVGKKPRGLLPDEIQLITSMAYQIGIAVENATLFEETRAKAKELSALYSIATEVNQTLDIGTLLRGVIHKVLGIFDFDAACIYLFDVDQNVLCLAAREGFPEDTFPPARLTTRQGITGRVFETGKPLIYENIQSDGQYSEWSYAKTGRRRGYQFLAVIPIKTRLRNVGALVCLGKKLRRLTPSEIQLIISMAENIGIPVDNSQLYEKTKKQAIQLEDDIKRIKKLERQQVESEKLTAAGRIAARVAHEINNPLAGIKNSFHLIKDAVPVDYPHYHYVGRIEKEIDRIARIVRQMFNLYRQDQEASWEFLVNETISDVVALLETNARQRDVKVQLVSNLMVAVTLPEGLLRQVLYNIIQNAIEASPDGQAVKITTELKDGLLEISVSDRGCGIQKELRSRIFEPFFSTKSGVPRAGLGLGLSVTKSMVDTMGGTLDFTSQVNQGTVFQIMLPLNGLQKEIPNG